MMSLGLKSLLNRRFVSLLTILSIALSVCLIVGVDRLRHEARAGFANSADGIDLIVASRGNPVQILLATVFGVGSTTNAIEWETFEAVRDLDAVAWAVPISMGDNLRGYPVIGTRPDYFTHFRHSGGEALSFEHGRAFQGADEAVLGAEVARRFSYGEGSEIVLAHGTGDVSFHMHDDDPFTVTGVLDRTGTSVDRMVLVSLQGFEGLHSEDPATAADPLGALLAAPPTASTTVQAAEEKPSPDHDGHDHGDHEGHDHGDHEGHDHGEHEGHDHGDHEGHDHGDHEGHDHGDH
ncbi:MAG: ABC transporter permease, partial [Pseudomonadota bacterium]